MLTTLTLISIFTEIFASGILLSGFVAFLKKFFEKREKQALFFGLLFLALFFYAAATVASQMMFNMGRNLPELVLVQKFISFQIILSSFFLWLFIVEKFKLKKLHILSWLLAVFASIFAYSVFVSEANLIYREGVLEPLVYYSLSIPIKSVFAVLWVLLGLGSFAHARRSKGGERVLSLFTGASSILFLAALYSINLYIHFAEAYFLLFSWILILISILGLLLGELIPPDSPLSRRPLSFFRTRILFKLMLIFVLLIVILFEVTTLATLSISKNALSSSIRKNYTKAAEELVRKIEAFRVEPSFKQLQEIVTSEKINERETAFIVDSQGYLLAHPDEVRALSHKDLSDREIVKKVLSGKGGSGEFRDPVEGQIVGAYLPISKFGWGVVVEEPLASAYFELRRLETNSLLFIISGIILTALVGIFFAWFIERSIREVILGTEAIAAGDLNYKIRVKAQDEIGKLAAAFNQMTKDLRDSQERLILSEKLASLGTMAAGMAHEIKNPLVSLRTFSQLLETRWEDPEFKSKFSSIVPQEIERINRIAESLLKFGKPVKPEMSRVNINSTLEEVLLLLESECKKNSIKVITNFAALPETKGDPGLLSQAFVNLILNAVQAMPGGGELSVKTDLGEMIRLPAKTREGVKHGEEIIWGEGEKEVGKPIPVIFVEISDTGEGISEENIKSLFDPFFSTKITGTGMGLPITLRIIEDHEGTIKVRSKAGEGTTFIITLPLKD